MKGRPLPPSDSEDAEAIADATAQRIVAAATAVTGHPPEGTGLAEAASSGLQDLVDRLRSSQDVSLAWLLLTAVAGCYPQADDVRAVRRAARLDDGTETALAVLDRARHLALTHRTADRPMRVVGDVVVDLDLCSRSDFHNGIQRVARETIRCWGAEHEITTAAWTDSGGALRSMSPLEEARARHWAEPLLDERRQEADDEPFTEFDLLVPWRTTVVLAEVPIESRCPQLAALAEFSGNRLVAIGYDAIPLVSADLRPEGEPSAFAAYLTVVKHSTAVAGISRSATDEFAGFAATLPGQGLTGPVVSEVRLPSEVPPAPAGWVRTAPATPRVLSVGRFEPHKNQGALLHAAELLWREGLDFSLDLIGGPGWSTTAVDAQLAALERAGRPVRRLGSVPEEVLWSSIREASFTVFVSLHEGFGLPVSESLACGTPVITSDYGSQGEIAEGGGCLAVDPRDDAAVTSAMRRLLTDPVELDRLRQEAIARPLRTWKQYATELWDVLMKEPRPCP
ncbi:glycosyltransferase family 4 protein [Actinotalea sp.]|uniref:glycosyltransferase family 4 protein n=1 Tax=Actinotalea sp. TaxID=1872145 RepID=UPI0035666983